MDVTEVASGSQPPSIATLTPNGSKGRFGVAYLRMIASQAGIGLNETSPDEDVLAIDCDLCFAIANVRVQVKCSSQFQITGRSASWSADSSWCGKWKQSLLPVYFVLVILDSETQEQWVEHHDYGTLQRAAAFWVRVNQLDDDAASISIPKSQRLSIDTFHIWENELLACFSGQGE